MEYVVSALTSDNGWLVAVLIIIILVLCAIGIKHGALKIKTDKIVVGQDASDLERTIMRQQIEWTKIACYSFEQKVPKFPEYDKYRGRFIIEKVFDEIIKWIAFNHIKDNDAYIRIKQDIVWNIIQKYAKNKAIMSKSFRHAVDNNVEYVIKNLVDIREQYSDKWGY